MILLLLLLIILRLSSEILVMGDGERFNRDFSTSVATLNVFRNFLSQNFYRI